MIYFDLSMVFICRVTVLKNEQLKSRGVAFIHFANAENARSCIELNNNEVKHTLNTMIYSSIKYTESSFSF